MASFTHRCRQWAHPPQRNIAVITVDEKAYIASYIVSRKRKEQAPFRKLLRRATWSGRSPRPVTAPWKAARAQAWALPLEGVAFGQHGRRAGKKHVSNRAAMDNPDVRHGTPRCFEKSSCRPVRTGIYHLHSRGRARSAPLRQSHQQWAVTPSSRSTPSSSMKDHTSGPGRSAADAGQDHIPASAPHAAGMGSLRASQSGQRIDAHQRAYDAGRILDRLRQPGHTREAATLRRRPPTPTLGASPHNERL